MVTWTSPCVWTPLVSILKVWEVSVCGGAGQGHLFHGDLTVKCLIIPLGGIPAQAPLI
jgi:hypothetical protein